MKSIHIIYIVTIGVLSMLSISCSKDGNDGENGGDWPSLPGYIYHQYTTEVQRVDMRTGEESHFFQYSAYGTAGWSMSPDGTLRLVSHRDAGVYDRNRFTVVSGADGRIIKEFDYVPLRGNSTANVGKISYDNSLILVEPDGDNGIVITDMDGNFKYGMDGIGELGDFSRGDRVYWLPGNSILILFNGRRLLRSDPPYTGLNLIKEMNYENWGNVRVRPDGKKISFYIDKHLYMMDIDGENLVQVTESAEDVAFGEFSPDGNYLLVAADYFHAPASGGSHWFLKIIPADGKKYNLDSDPQVIPLIPNGSSRIVRANGVTAWRP